MSQHGPCKSCGKYINVGAYQDLVCSQCEHDTVSGTPNDNTLEQYIEDHSIEEAETVHVTHPHYGGDGVIDHLVYNSPEPRAVISFDGSEPVDIHPAYLGVVQE